MNWSGIWAALPVASMLLGLWGLVVLHPFKLVVSAFEHTAGVRLDAEVARLYKDPRTQETSRGEHPLASLRQLESEWSTQSGHAHFVLCGNSQTMTVLLAPQEPARNDQDEFTYPDLLMKEVTGAGSATTGYRLSAPNITYMEVLWYLHYLLARPALTPRQLIVQLNYQTFRLPGVRDGMLELLQDPVFYSAIEDEAHSSSPYAATFQQAIDRYHSQVAKVRGTETAAGKTGLLEARGIGSAIETDVRDVLGKSAAFRSRTEQKGDFLNVLYLARVHLLGLKPTSKRSLGGAVLESNSSAIARVGELCRQNGIRLTLFNAPQNPVASLYKATADRDLYLKVIGNLSTKYAWRYFDFENSVPSEMWGIWIDGPDPIHFGRAAHQKLADLMFTAGVVAGGE